MSVDWGVARTLGRAVGGQGTAQLPVPADEVVLDAAASAEQAISAYTALQAPKPLPRAEAVGRAGWVDANLASMAALLDPLAADLGGGVKLPLVGTVLGAGLGAQVGLLAGLLSQRVLGQYDIALLEPERPARLLLVAPNLGEAAERLQVDVEALWRWVTLHEVTHALQFEGVPWLRPHLAERARALLEGVSVDVQLKLPGTDDLKDLVAALRRGDLAALGLGAGKRGELERLQALMSVIEGYAEHVMDAAAADVVGDVEPLRAALERRRDRRGPWPWRIFELLLGLDQKLRQYREGKAFCDAVVAEGGIEALDQVWTAPEALPTAAEVTAPSDWLARVAA